MKRLFFLFCFFVFGELAFAQFKNNKWLMGQQGNSPELPWGGSKIVFEGNERTISHDPRSMRFSACFTGLSDEDDNWFVYSNGTAVCNKNHDTLVNGNGLSPGGSEFGSLYGQPIASQSLFIPTLIENRQILFHQNLIAYSGSQPFIGQPISLTLYYSIINPLENNFQGAIASKNNIIINDTLEIGKIAAVRHANGRDWWVFVKRFYNDLFYSILVTPDSVYAPDTCFTSEPNTVQGGHGCISPNGKHYVSFSNISTEQLRLYDLNRCTGKINNFRQKFITNNIAGFVSFSPSSRFLYVGSIDTLWQFDMEANDVFSSQTFIGAYDGFIDSTFNNGTAFWRHWLAPDGKIYITTSTQSLKLHVINNPDMPGLACDFQQHSVDIPTISNKTIPTPINYDLKQESGSPCDTLGVGLQQLKIKDLELQIFPNPSTGRFSMEYSPQVKSGMLYVYDMQGKEVYREYVSPYTSIKNIDISNKLSNGLYGLSLDFGNNRTTKTIVINKE
jgi:hypothetical protein